MYQYGMGNWSQAGATDLQINAALAGAHVSR